MTWQDFEVQAQQSMSKHYGKPLSKQRLAGLPKTFDLVSPRGEIVGDAKFLTLVGRTKLPPAKFMEIAGHVWLLEKTHASDRFLVFGNQREVPEMWLQKYGQLATDVSFYFLHADGKLELLQSRKNLDATHNETNNP